MFKGLSPGLHKRQMPVSITVDMFLKISEQQFLINAFYLAEGEYRGKHVHCR